MTVTTDPLKTGISALKYLGERTQATLPSAASWSGYTATLTDLGENGTYVHSNGTRWRVLNGSGSLKTLGAAVTGIANSETIVLQTLIPAGAWQTNDLLLFNNLSILKSGTTDTGRLTVRIGTAGTTADTAITGLSAMSIVSAANTMYGASPLGIKLVSATSAQRLGQNSIVPFGGASSGSIAATTISDASSNALYVSVSLSSSGTTDTLTIQSADIQISTP